MRFRDFLLSEARIMFSKDDLDKEYVANKIAHVYITKNGEIHLGYNPLEQPERHFSSEIGLWPDRKQITIRKKSIGGKVDPKTQQLLSALLKAQIIDNSWSLDAGNIGFYGARGSQYHHHPEDINTAPLSKMASRSNRFDPTTKELFFYHGTSELDWGRIKKVGLLPLFQGNTEPGYESRDKHEYNKDHIYLAPLKETVWHYATVRARAMSKKYAKDSYWEHSSPCAYPIRPVIIKVRIPDPYKLRADDDVVNGILRKLARKAWDDLPPEQKKSEIARVSKKVGFDISSAPDFTWREDDEVFDQLLKKIPAKSWNMWLASIKKYDQVAYKGRIPPQYLELIDVCDVKAEEES